MWSRAARSASLTLVEVGEPGAEFVVRLAEPTPGCVFDEQVVDGDVEELGKLHDRFDRGRDLAVLVAADLAGVTGDLRREVGLGPSALFAEDLDLLADLDSESLEPIERVLVPFAEVEFAFVRRSKGQPDVVVRAIEAIE